MANKRYDQFSTVAPTTSRIILHADPATGTLGKCTIANELALVPATQTLLSSFQALGSPILSISGAINPIQTNGSGNLGNTLIWWVWNMLPACTVTGAWYSMGDDGIFTAVNFNGFGMYSTSGGTLTRIALTANNANFFKAGTSLFAQAPFTAPIAVTAGNYWLAIIYNFSAQTHTPQVRIAPSTTNYIGQTLGFTNGEKTVSLTGSSGTLPTSVLWSTIPLGNYTIPITGFY